MRQNEKEWAKNKGKRQWTLEREKRLKENDKREWESKPMSKIKSERDKRVKKDRK